MVMNNISKGSCVSRGGGGTMFHWPKPAFGTKPRDEDSLSCWLLWFGFVIWTDSCVLFDVIRWLKRSIHIRLCTLLLHITYHVNIYTCVTPCIFTCNYLWCLNAWKWRCGLQTFFRTWVTRVSMLFNHLIDGYYHSLFICITFRTHYYHNITQLGVKCLHLTGL